MKKLFLTAPLLVLLSCSNNERHTKETNTANTNVKETPTDKALNAAGTVSTAEVEDLCYLLIEGNGKDSLVATLSVKGNDVTGYLIYNYYEKDGRFGRLSCKKNGNEIKGDWIYMQEGMKDTVAVAFKMNGNKLEQKKHSFNPRTGEEFLPDDAPYYRSFNQVNCMVTEGLTTQANKFL